MERTAVTAARPRRAVLTPPSRAGFAAALLAALGVALVSPPAGAIPRYAAREGRSCLVCHVNPSGAGPLTEAGEFYRRNDYSFAGFQAQPEAPPPEPARAELLARLERLEQEMAALKRELALAPPEEVAPPPVPVAPAPEAGRVAMSGYSEFVFANRRDANSNFDMLRVVPILSAQIAPRLFFNAEIEFEHLADVTLGGEVAVEQATLDFLVRPDLNFRAGGILVPFNQLNLLHDGPLRELTDRPLVAQFIVPTTWTEPGAGVFGAAALGRGVSVNYEAYLVNGLGPGISDHRGLRDARRRGLRDNNQNKALVARLGVAPARGLELGISGYEGKWDDANQLGLSMLGADWTYRRGPLKVVGEWAKARVERDAEAAAEGVPPGLAGYYLEASYRLNRWTPVLHFSRIDTDTSRVTVFDRERLAVGVNYRAAEQALIKLEWQRNRERADPVSDNGVVGSVTHYF